MTNEDIILINKDGKICGLYYGKATCWVGLDGEEERGCQVAMTVPEVVKGLNHRMAIYNEFGLRANSPLTLSLPTSQPREE